MFRFFSTAKGFDERIGLMAEKLNRNEKVAVSWMYDATNGNITELGNQWRDRIEKALTERGVQVTSRQEIPFLIDESESFGDDKSIEEILENAKADVVIGGKYVVAYKGGGADKFPEIRLTIKPVRKGSVIKAIEWREELEPVWERLAATVHGNAYQLGLKEYKHLGSDNPQLSARLDRNPPCYPPDMPATLYVKTEAGVYLYLLGMAADHTVTLLYPNKILPEQTLVSAKFIFPPPSLRDKLQLVFFPLKEDELCQESIKIVASRNPLDFSFLPIPENRIYKGAKGGEINRMLEVLERSKSWEAVDVPYTVGLLCE